MVPLQRNVTILFRIGDAPKVLLAVRGIFYRQRGRKEALAIVKYMFGKGQLPNLFHKLHF